MSAAALERAAAMEAAALARYLDRIGGLGDEAWHRPLAPGQWSPSQVTEHLALAYDVVAAELRGGAGMAERLPPWRRRLLRWFLLPHILFHRSFPLRAPSPRELRPAQPSVNAAAGAARLRAAADGFATALSLPERRGWMTHAYFGRVSVERAVRFVGIHLDHHRAQVERAPG
jgi:uncharacterized damage-inducible protein DinB